jgi:cysteine desulfurase
LIAGLGKAAQIAHQNLTNYDKTVRPMRDALEKGILDLIPGAELNGHKTARLANTTNITFQGVESEALLLLLDQEGVCASSGSACLADSNEPSHVVHAMKPQTDASREVIRLSLGLSNKVGEINETIKIIQEAVNALRQV